MSNKITSKTSIKLPKLARSLTISQQRYTPKQFKPQENPQNITAQAYAIYTASLKPILQYQRGIKREIASLTKMMTLHCVIKLCRKFQITRSKCYLRVTANAAGTRGTTAQLQSRQWVSIQDLLYGVMLPSGNDACCVLAQNFGACLYYDRLGQSKMLIGTLVYSQPDLKSLDLTEDTWNLKIYTEQFIRYMNTCAKQLGMKDTHYVNPHGLDCSYRLQAYSVVQDLALLAKQLMQDEQCLAVMSKLQHTAQLKTISGKQVQVRKMKWKNTHLLLGEKGFMAGKTGQTQNAGNCLVSVCARKGLKYILVVLGCATKELRFQETRLLASKYIK